MINHSVLSDSDIVRLYKHSRYPAKQIKILSELCDCTYAEMYDFLDGVTPIVWDKSKFVYFGDTNLIQVVWMRDHGLSWKEVEEIVGISWRVLARQIRKEGIR